MSLGLRPRSPGAKSARCKSAALLAVHVMHHDVLLAAQSTKRFVEVQELAGFALFLCTDEARSMTGTLLPVDGGWTAH